MLLNNEGIWATLSKITAACKKFGAVIARPNKIKGRSFANSWERLPLMYAVILTEATNAAEIRRTVSKLISWANTNINIDNTMNQKKVIIGKTIMYSKM